MRLSRGCVCDVQMILPGSQQVIGLGKSRNGEKKRLKGGSIAPMSAASLRALPSVISLPRRYDYRVCPFCAGGRSGWFAHKIVGLFLVAGIYGRVMLWSE